MNRALVAVPALALLGVAGVVAVVVAWPDSEEGVVQQPATAEGASFASPTSSSAASITPAPSVTPTPDAESLPICPPLPATSWVWRPPSASTQYYANEELGFSLLYPSDWTVCRIQPDPQLADGRGGLEFHDSSGLLHASIYVWSNPTGAALEDWYRYHRGEVPSERVAVGGEPAIFISIGAEGTPTAGAVFAQGARIYEISSLKIEDFDALRGQFRFS